MRWGRIYIIPTESTLAVPPTCLQGAWYARSLQSKYTRRLRPLRHAYVGGTGHARWRHGCRGPGWHSICICRPPKPYRQRTSEVHHRALHARVCYVPAGDAAHAAVIVHCSITAACSLRAPASLKTRTGDVRRRYGSLRFGYRIRRRPAAERCTAGCDRGFRVNWDLSTAKVCFRTINYHRLELKFSECDASVDVRVVSSIVTRCNTREVYHSFVSIKDTWTEQKYIVDTLTQTRNLLKMTHPNIYYDIFFKCVFVLDYLCLDIWLRPSIKCTYIHITKLAMY